MAEETDWTIRPIRKEHIRDKFDSGEPALDGFLRKYARQNEEKGLGRTFVATRPGSLQAVGYFTIRSGSILFDNMPADEQRKLPQYPIPVIHLGRLAVDRTVQGQGLGQRLLIEAIRKAIEISRSLAIYAIEVVAKNEDASRFYEKYGFKPLADDRFHLYLSMRTVRKVFK